ncbi:MAG: aldehyde dehydrogenase family protein [Ideonella sp.]|nr:aldehyde dehydrogenase family protein [Ideonella sp.]
MPVGPGGGLHAWNFPANLPARKTGSALAPRPQLGDQKPAEETAGHLPAGGARPSWTAGLPPEALNLVWRAGAGEPNADRTRPSASLVHRLRSPVGKRLGARSRAARSSA